MPASVACLVLPASPLDVGAFSLAEGGGHAACGNSTYNNTAELRAYAQQATSIKGTSVGGGAAVASTHRDHWAVLTNGGVDGQGPCIVLRDLEARRVSGSGSAKAKGAAARGGVTEGISEALYQVIWAVQDTARAGTIMSAAASAAQAALPHTVLMHHAVRGDVQHSASVHVASAWALALLQQAHAMPGASLCDF